MTFTLTENMYIKYTSSLPCWVFNRQVVFTAPRSRMKNLDLGLGTDHTIKQKNCIHLISDPSAKF